MKFKLLTFSNNLCTVGVLYDDLGKRICDTIEKPWKGNAPDISCVPAGIYDFKPRLSPSQGETYYLENKKLGVTLSEKPGRTFIQIDIANIQSELLGCIAVGNGFGIYKNEWSVRDSAKTKGKLMKLLNGENHTLEIKRY